ncbi:hypothetical protein AAVH_34734, partial [Aphelenchoides avenae]
MRLKTEASGYPPGVVTDEQKRQYVEDVERSEGIKLNPANIRKNPGLRYIAKLCLNSLWGRFGLRNKLSKTVVTQSPSEFYKLAFSDRVELNSVMMVNPETVSLVYTPKSGFVEE